MQSLLQHLFKKNALQEISVDELQQFVRQHPSFGIAHFLLSKKLQSTNEPEFKEQLSKTTLYFHNPLWLAHQLQQETVETELPDRTNENRETVAPQGTPNIQLASHDLIEDVILHQETVYKAPEEDPGINEHFFDNDAAIEESGSKLFREENHTIGQERNDVPARHSFSESSKASVGEHAHTMKEFSEGQLIISSEEPLPFQAYHTIDYFASQGIRIGQDLQPDDKLSKHLKSFTEWLKTMRRLPEVPGEMYEKSSDPEIEKLAAHSLLEKEVITEAMAEVLIKQGKREKAREVYHKLSLLNPGKLTYFAAKIEALNYL